MTLIRGSDYLIIQVSWPLLGVPLTLNTVTALVAICAAVVIYAQVYLFFVEIFLLLTSLVSVGGVVVMLLLILLLAVS